MAVYYINYLKRKRKKKKSLGEVINKLESVRKQYTDTITCTATECK